MKRFFILLLCIISSNQANSTLPISADLLFTGPDHYSMKISPNGEFILTYDYGEEFNTLDLVDPIKKEQYPLLELEHDRQIHIKTYEWINSSTIYLELGDRKGFLYID